MSQSSNKALYLASQGGRSLPYSPNDRLLFLGSAATSSGRDKPTHIARVTVTEEQLEIARRCGVSEDAYLDVLRDEHEEALARSLSGEDYKKMLCFGMTPRQFLEFKAELAASMSDEE